MPTLSPTAYPTASLVMQAVEQIRAQGLSVPDEVEMAFKTQNWPMALDGIAKMKGVMDTNTENTGDINNSLNQIEQFVQGLMTANPSPETPETEIAAKKKLFNFKKAQMPMQPVGTTNPNPPVIDDFDIGPDIEPIADPMEEELAVQDGQIEQFATHHDVIQWLSQQPDPATAINQLGDLIGQGQEFVDSHTGGEYDSLELIKQGVEGYFNAIDEFSTEEEILTAQEEASKQIFEALPSSVKPEQAEGSIEAPYVKVESMYKDYIESSAKEIQRLAKEVAQRKRAAQKFNLSKTAQHHTDQNMILYGPGEKRLDPFYRQPVSDWHIVERNKGFGLTVDDVWNIDWEAIWRGTVMDKYSRPYRDKDGNWVGGYMEKRFEVDKWIPETSNMQLKPGQKRKPRVPEYGVTEARLQANRAEDNRGYGPNSDTSAPFNWNTASSKKNVKLANIFESLERDRPNQFQSSVDTIVDDAMREPLPSDVEQEMERELEMMDDPDQALGGQSPKQIAKELLTMERKNPGSVDIERHPQRVQDAFNAGLMTDKILGHAAESDEKIKTASWNHWELIPKKKVI